MEQRAHDLDEYGSSVGENVLSQDCRDFSLTETDWSAGGGGDSRIEPFSECNSAIVHPRPSGRCRGNPSTQRWKGDVRKSEGSGGER